MGRLIWIASLASSTTTIQHFHFQIIVDFGRSIAMKLFTPFSVLLFVLTANALPYQSNNGFGRFDQDVDGVDSLIDRIALINERQGMLAPIGGVVAGGPLKPHQAALGGVGGALGGLAGGFAG